MLWEKIHKRIRQIARLIFTDRKLAIKIFAWFILRKTIFKLLETDLIFPIVTKRSIKLETALFPIDNLSVLTSKENCLEYLFGIYEPWVQAVIEKNISTGRGIYRYRSKCWLFFRSRRGKGEQKYMHLNQ